MKSLFAKLLIGGALLTTACRDRGREAARADSALARDLELASAQTATPTFQDTAVASSPAPKSIPPIDPPPARARIERKPANAPPRQPAPLPPQAPAPVVAPQSVAPAATPDPTPSGPRGEIESGSAALLTSGSKVCTSSNMVGDKLVATLTTPLVGSHSAELPAGATVVLEVAWVQSGDKADNAQITFRVRSVVVGDKTYNVVGDVTPMAALDRTKVQSADPNAEKKKVAGGAIAGAILGQMIGRNAKGTIIGAVAGAAAGAAAAKAGEKWEACLPSGAQLQLKLTERLVLS